MSIGLYDEDMARYTHIPFNIDLMKIASYYKSRREIVMLSRSFEADKYSKFILRKDYYDGQFEPLMLSRPNVEYGGLAFTNNIYIPMAEDIEKSKPDTTIYERWRHLFGTNEKMKTIFNNMFNGEHIRLSLDGKTLQPNIENQINLDGKPRHFIIHDYNPTQVAGATDFIEDLARNFPTARFGTKFPMVVTNKEDLFKWQDFPFMHDLYTIQYNGIMEDELFYEFFFRSKTKTQLAQFEYNITGGGISEKEVIAKLPQVFLQIIFSQSYQQRITLIYDKDFFFNPKWERLIDLWNAYLGTNTSISLAKKQLLAFGDTLFCFAKKLRKKDRYKNEIILIDEARELFGFVRENHYELFKMFYETAAVSFKGGKFQDDGYLS